VDKGALQERVKKLTISTKGENFKSKICYKINHKEGKIDTTKYFCIHRTRIK